MPKKTGDFLKDILTKAGVDLTKDELKKILEITEEMPDDVYDAANKALMTVAAAQENPEVIKKVKATALNAVDKKIEDALAELELEADDDFKGNKNSYDKIGLLAKLAKAAGEKKTGAGSAKDKTEWADKEKEYNRQLADLKKNIETQKTEFEATRKNDTISFELKQLLGGKNYVFPKEMDASVKVNTALATVQGELAKKGFSINMNEHGQLCILTKDGTPAYSDTHVALEPNTFIDGVLAQQKLLAVNKEVNPGAGGAGNGGTDIIGGGAGKGNMAVVNEIAQELQALNAQG